MQKLLKINPERFFLVFISVAGILSCFITPIGAGFDEDTHVARIWEMSSGTLIPNKNLGNRANFPSVFHELSYRQKMVIEPIEKNFFSENKFKKIDWDVMIDYNTRSIYFPILYLPQALLMGITGRLFDFSVLFIYYLIRLSYLSSYILLSYFAIRLMPHGKWLMVLMMLSPMCVIQASIISPDSVNHGMSFLAIASFINLSISPKKTFDKKEIILILVLAASLFMLKVNSFALIFLFFIIPSNKFKSKRVYLIVLLAIFILFATLILGWNYLTASQLTVTGNAANTVVEQTLYILKHPFEYSLTVLRNGYSRLPQDIKEWIGVFGYKYWIMPDIVYVLYILLIILTMLSDDTSKFISTKVRAKLIITFILGYLLTVTLLYLKDNAVGANTINYLQGRYFIPFFPVLFLAFQKKRPSLSTEHFRILFSFGMAFLTIIYLSAMFLAYHVTCGTSYYTFGDCYQPIYKNWDPNTRFTDAITAEVVFEQEFLVKCDSIDSIRMWTSQAQQPGATTTILVSEIPSEQIIHEETFKNTSFSPNQWTNIDISATTNSFGQRYQIALVSNSINDEKAIAAALSTRKEYQDGLLHINNTSVEYDMIFQYRCLTD